MKILIAEDEKAMSDALAMVLRHFGYEVDTVPDGLAAVEKVQESAYDCMVFDVMMPRMDGVEALKRIRSSGDVTPVILLTAKAEVDDRIIGLDAGADDYLTKPFAMGELMARIRAAVRHTRTPEGAAAVANSGVFTAGELTIDYDKHRIYIAGRDANLTQNEYKLVALLGLHAGKVLTYDYLIKELWGPSARSDNQILRVNMANIRKKLGCRPGDSRYVINELGVGYRIADE